MNTKAGETTATTSSSVSLLLLSFTSLLGGDGHVLMKICGNMLFFKVVVFSMAILAAGNLKGALSKANLVLSSKAHENGLALLS